MRRPRDERPAHRAHARPARGVLRDGVRAYAHAPGAPQQAGVRARERKSERLRATALQRELRAPELALLAQRLHGRPPARDAEERDAAVATACRLRTGDRDERG